MTNKSSVTERRHEVSLQRGAKNQGRGDPGEGRTDKTGVNNRKEPPWADQGSARTEKHVRNTQK